MAEERLQKIIARCGIASRRGAEDLIRQGLVTVNGRTATIGMKADPDRDHIKVEGRLINRPEPETYLLLYKPKKCLTTMYDPLGRPTIKDLLKGVKVRVFPVGRLDFDSEGLLLLTNDGDLANTILHPRYKVPKTYHVKIDGVLDERDIKKLQRGVMLEEGLTAPARVREIGRAKVNSWIEITIHEGRKRQIRRMLERIGHPVIRLIRVRIDGIGIGNLSPGTYRYLSHEELNRLREFKAKSKGEIEGL